MTAFLEPFKMDRYDLNARLKPALFALLPALLMIFVWVPQAWTLLGSAMTLIVGCGVLLFLAQVSRRRGRIVEEKMGDQAGRAHSARLLRLDDGTFPTQTKIDLRTLIENEGQIVLRDERIGDTAENANNRLAAVYWLLKRTKPKASETLLLEDNIRYGFSRNLLGLKSIALIVAIGALTVNSWLLFVGSEDKTQMQAGLVIEGALVLVILAWLMQVNRGFVADASKAYAERLFAVAE